MIQISKLINLNKPLILASKSPRRRKLLANLGFEFEVMPSNYKEAKHNNINEIINNKHSLSDKHPPYGNYAMDSAFHKAAEVAGYISNHAIILGADTIVVLNDEILHKPKDKDDAFRILKTLSNNIHTVYTGIALIDTENNKSIKDVQSTKVTFRKLDDNEIRAYIDTGSPMDKAGAYGIQDDFGAVFVSHIEGCYYNIVGLPLELLYISLKKILNN